MWVTAYTDASYLSRKNIGAWAIFLRSDEGEIKKSGLCPDGYQSATACEVYAAGMALLWATKEWKKVSAMQINSDSEFVVTKLIGDAKLAKSKAIREAQEKFMVFSKEKNLFLKFKKVKAHGTKEGGRSKLNHHVDQEAKRALTKGIKSREWREKNRDQQD